MLLIQDLVNGMTTALSQHPAEARCVVQGYVERPALPLCNALIQALSWVVHCLRHVT